MDFKEFAGVLCAHIRQMCEGQTHLFQVELDKKFLWQLYQASFAPEHNRVYKERREHDCNTCHSFVRALGNVVAIKPGVGVVSIWDVTGVGPYQASMDAMAKFVHGHTISDVFMTETHKFGVEKNYGEGDLGVITWHHMYVELPQSIILTRGADIASRRGALRDNCNVLRRALQESVEATDTLLDLMAQGSLYKGEEWRGLTKLRELQAAYSALQYGRDLFCWTKSIEVGPAMSKIRNSSIGTLLVNLSDGMPLDQAVRAYEKITAPSNYKRPKAIFTKDMVRRAEQDVEQMGYLHSLPRRHATLDDITLPNILFANRDAQTRMEGGVFDALKERAKADGPRNFGKLEEVPWETFVGEVLPGVQTVELFLDNAHQGNMVTLVAPKNLGAPSMFKWGNPFSWAYTGNITDSMKELVKAAGGEVGGVLRFSIMWNEAQDNNNNDFDAHCIEPTGNRIYFGNKFPNVHPSSGRLDVDIVQPFTQRPDQPAVENITWTDRKKMPNGVYKFLVHNYRHNGGRTGFQAEIEFDGQLFTFSYPHELRHGEEVHVAEVRKMASGEFRLTEKLKAGVQSRDIWGLKSGEFHPVTVVMFSPNYWDQQDGIGHRHLFFMLDRCINPEEPNGFFNEFLKQDLMQHKRVFEALGAQMRVQASPDQLSGVGFSTTKRNNAVCRVGGRIDRTLKVHF